MSAPHHPCDDDAMGIARTCSGVALISNEVDCKRLTIWSSLVQCSAVIIVEGVAGMHASATRNLEIPAIFPRQTMARGQSLLLEYTSEIVDF
jgi:hypothetical protein